VTAVLVLGAVITGLLSAASKGAAPDPTVIAGYALVVGATVLLIALPSLRRPGAAHAVAGG
jgi:hypothetical protein